MLCLLEPRSLQGFQPSAYLALTLHGHRPAIGVKAVDVIYMHMYAYIHKYIEQCWSSSELLQMTLTAAMLACVQCSVGPWYLHKVGWETLHQPEQA